MQDFIKELKKIEKAFIAEAQRNTEKVDLESYSIDICKGYLSQRIECSDENEDTVVITQEIEQNQEGLTALGTHYYY